MFVGFGPQPCFSVFGPGFGGGAGGSGGGDVTINQTITEITASGVSEDAGQVLTEGTDGGALLLGNDIRVALDTTLGGIDWRQAEAERLLSYDVASRTVDILAGTGVALPLATTADAGLMSAADKQALAAATGGTGGMAVEITRNDIQATTVDAGLATIRTSGYAAPGDGGGGLYVRAGSEPQHSAKVQSADGAWWELVPQDGRVNVLQLGAARTTDGASPQTDAHPAFAAAIEFAERFDRGNIRTGIEIGVPPGRYLIGQTLELRAAVRLIGQASTGAVENWPVELNFADTAGLIVHAARSVDTGSSAETPDDPATMSANGAVIEGLYFHGPGAGNGFDVLKPGIRLHSRAVLRDIMVADFSGHGVHIEADVLGDFSNANIFMIYNLSTRFNGGSGLFVKDFDANAGHIFGLDMSANGRFGIEERSFLGNHYFGVHTQSNGTRTAGQDLSTSIVTLGGATYTAAIGASEADLVATQPGTNEDVWRQDFSTDTINSNLGPAWSAGQPVGTYVVGGSVICDGPTNQSVINGLYNEANQGRAVLDQRTMVLGGLTGGIVPGSNGAGYAQAGPNVDAHSGLSFGSAEGVSLRVHNLPREVFNIMTDGTPDGLRLTYDPFVGGGVVNWKVRFDADISQSFTLDESTVSFGRPSAIGRGHTYFRQGAFFGSDSQARQIVFHDDQMADTDHGPGDLVLDSGPSEGAPIGWLWLTAHDASGSAGTVRQLWQVPTLDGAVTLPGFDTAGLATEGAAGHVGTLAYRSDVAAPVFSDGANWRDMRALRVVEKTGAATLATDEAFALIRFTGASPATLTIPAGAMAVGDQISVVQSGQGPVTLAAGAGVTLDAEVGLTIRAQHGVASVVCIAPDTYVAVGALDS
ncbi:MAG: hypothetical protein AAFU49_11855 [Pseudomonadota bacterium]